MASALPAETPAPFPVSAQYVRALRDVDHGELAEEIVSAPASKPKQAKGRGRRILGSKYSEEEMTGNNEESLLRLASISCVTTVGNSS